MGKVIGIGWYRCGLCSRYHGRNTRRRQRWYLCWDTRGPDEGEEVGQLELGAPVGTDVGIDEGDEINSKVA